MRKLNFKKVKGFQDIYGNSCAYWLKAENEAHKVSNLFGIEEIRIPILEHTEIFARGVGATTDIVEKEMFTFTDRDSKDEAGDLLTMRPEGTSGVVRSYIENGMFNPPILKKFYYLGNMFRRENPQKGRFRQFTQYGIEYLGTASPLADADVIDVFVTYFRENGVSNLCRLEINSVGCPKCRPNYNKLLLTYLNAHKDGLCGDCHQRLGKNPLRILDCKEPKCRVITESAPKMLEHLCDECHEHFDGVKKYLKLLDIDYVINDRMVRGLDYYVRTAFEMITGHLGSASAVGGGGRYDGLVETLGGPDTPGVGFAIGVDRVVELMKINQKLEMEGPDVFVISFDGTRDKAVELLGKLRKEGISAEIDFDLKGLKNQMKQADRDKAVFAVIVGGDELARGEVTLRDLSKSEQETIKIESLIDTIKIRKSN